MMVKLKASGPPQDNAGLTYLNPAQQSVRNTRTSKTLTPTPPRLPNPKTGTKLSTVECLATNKKTTSKGKLCSCKPGSRVITYTKTSGQGSTSNAGDYSPFWTTACSAWSRKLWSLAWIDSADSHLSSLNGSWNAKEPNLPSWSKVMNLQNTNCLPMLCPSFRFSAVGEMANAGTPTEKQTATMVTRVLKVKLRLSTRQKKTLRRWESGYRFTYNKALELKRGNPKLSKLELRNLVVTKQQSAKTLANIKKHQDQKQVENISPKGRSAKGPVHAPLFGPENMNPLFKQHRWLLSVPKDIRQQGSFELSKNWSSTRGKTDFKPAKSQGGSWTFSIERDHVSILQNQKVRLYSGSLKLVLRMVGKRLPSWLTPLGDEAGELEVTPPCQVIVQKRGKSYYMVFPYQKAVIQSTSTSTGHMAGLDPGCRKFLSMYGTDGRVGYFGRSGLGKRFFRMQWYKDYLQSGKGPVPRYNAFGEFTNDQALVIVCQPVGQFVMKIPPNILHPLLDLSALHLQSP